MCVGPVVSLFPGIECNFQTTLSPFLLLPAMGLRNRRYLPRIENSQHARCRDLWRGTLLVQGEPASPWPHPACADGAAQAAV